MTDPAAPVEATPPVDPNAAWNPPPDDPEEDDVPAGDPPLSPAVLVAAQGVLGVLEEASRVRVDITTPAGEVYFSFTPSSVFDRKEALRERAAEREEALDLAAAERKSGLIEAVVGAIPSALAAVTAITSAAAVAAPPQSGFTQRPAHVSQPAKRSVGGVEVSFGCGPGCGPCGERAGRPVPARSFGLRLCRDGSTTLQEGPTAMPRKMPSDDAAMVLLGEESAKGGMILVVQVDFSVPASRLVSVLAGTAQMDEHQVFFQRITENGELGPVIG